MIDLKELRIGNWVRGGLEITGSIEAKLRIGNWVRGDLEITGSIEATLHMNQDREFQIQIEHFHIFASWPHLLNAVSPVLITEEWLLKLGYQYANENGQKFYWHIELPYFQLRKEDESWSLWYEEMHLEALISEMDILYVHQIQNCYFILKGKEIEMHA